MRLGIAQQLHDFFLRHGHRALLSLEYQLRSLRQDGLLCFRWEFGHGGRSKQPRFFTFCPEKDIAKQRLGLPGLGGEQHHVDFRAVLVLQNTQLLRVILSTHGTQRPQHLLLRLPAGVFGQVPVASDVRHQVLDQRLAVGRVRALLGCLGVLGQDFLERLHAHDPSERKLPSWRRLRLRLTRW